MLHSFQLPAAVAKEYDRLTDVFHDVAIGEWLTKPKAHHDVPTGAPAVPLQLALLPRDQHSHGCGCFFLGLVAEAAGRVGGLELERVRC